ncbi:MAG TPA: CARDB domain-containing protein [Polyangiaceae bacterium]
MTCPDLYIGASRAAAPPSPFWTNPAIAPPSTNLEQGVAVTINVSVRNHGSDDSPATTLQLFYSDPQTGFSTIGQIGSNQTITVLGATTLPVADGIVTTPFGWTPPAAATLPNGGHVCLLARVRMQTDPPDSEGINCVQEIYGANPPTDKLQGIRNIHVYAPAGAKKGRRKAMQFAFGAMNNLPDTDKTVLQVKLLDPQQDIEALEALADDAVVDQALRARRLKFAVPNALLVGTGRERVQNTRFRAYLKAAAGTELPCPPRLSRTGPIAGDVLPHLMAPGTKLADAQGALQLSLNPGEISQTIVQVEPCKRDDAVYAVQISHAGADGRPIGGLTILFVPPHDYF